MTKRKTIDVESVKEYCNSILARKYDGMFITPEVKHGVVLMIDHILMETGNYKGYGYLDQNTDDRSIEREYNRFYY